MMTNGVLRLPINNRIVPRDREPSTAIVIRWSALFRLDEKQPLQSATLGIAKLRRN